MQNASASARAFASTMYETGESVNDFTVKQKMQQYEAVTSSRTFGSYKTVINEYNSQIKKSGKLTTEFSSAVKTGNPTMAKYLTSLNGARGSLSGYIGYLFKAKLATIGLQVATTALNAALSYGISLLIQGIITGLSKLINYESEAAEKAKEAAEASKQVADNYAQESKELSDLIKQYKELASSDQWDVETRAKVADIQQSITKLVGEQADSLDLVNGKLDEELQKLYQIKNTISEKTTSSYEKAYKDAQKAVSDYDKHNANWIYDMTEGDNSITFDYWGDNEGRNKALKIVDELWREKGYGRASEEYIEYDLLGLFYDTFSKLTFNDNLNTEQQIKALDEAIDALKEADDFDYANSEFWNKLVEIRNELAGTDGVFTQQINAATALLKNLTESEIGNGIDVSTVEEFNEYKREIIKKIIGNDVIEEAMKDGALSGDAISNYVNNYFSTMEKYSDFFKKVNPSSEVDRVSEALTSFNQIIKALKGATDEFNESGQVSADTYKDVIAFNKDYADLFDFSNGRITIASDKVNNLVNSLISEYGATLAANGATETQIATMVTLAKSLTTVEQNTDKVVSAIKDLADILKDAVDGTEMTALETLELIENYPELASAITKTTNGYLLEEEAVKRLIRAKAELLSFEVSEARTTARNNLINGSGNVETANNVDRLFLDYYNKTGTNISSFEEYQSAWESYYGKKPSGNWVDGLQEYVESVITDNSVNSVMNSIIEDLKNPDTLLSSSKDVETIKDAFDELEKIYNGRLQGFDYLSTTYKNAIKSLENQGYKDTSAYYEKLKDIEQQKIQVLGEELTALTQKFQDAINSGEIKEGSAEFYEMNNAINSVKSSIQEASLALQEYSNAIRDIEWDKFDKKQSRISEITEESNFLLGLLNNGDLVDKSGNLTKQGSASVGLHGVNYNIYLEQAQRYANEISKIESELANDKNNQTLIDRRNELLGLQRDSVRAAEDEKKAIVDLIKDGIEAQVDALDDLIDKYKDALDSAKDLYDYQNKVSDATKEISKLQKMIIAYENDTSEETKAQIQKLKVDLQKAEEDLRETEYSQFIADQKKLLDALFINYQTILNKRLDDVDSLISSSIESINTNATEIKGTLESTANQIGITLSDKMQEIWTINDNTDKVVQDFKSQFTSNIGTTNTNLGNINSSVTTVNSTLSTIDSDIDKAKTSINSGISSLSGNLSSAVSSIITAIYNSGNAHNSGGSGGTGSTGGTKIQDSAPKTVITPNTSTPSSVKEPTAQPEVKNPSTEEIIADMIVKFGDASGSGMSAKSSGDNGIIKWNGNEYKVQNSGTVYNSSTPLYKAAVNVLGFQDRQIFGYKGKVYGYLDGHIQELEGRFWSKAGYNDFVSAMKANYPAFKKGGIADFTGLAWLDGTKTNPEMVLDSQDTKNFISLRDSLEKMANANITYRSPYYSTFEPVAHNSGLDLNSKLQNAFGSRGETRIENHIDINIPIERVEDYNDFVRQLQHDRKFEKMIQDMTVNRISGGSSLSKYKYSWDK